MKILILDNYDSFTYNLVELIRREAEVLVKKNDACSLAELEAWQPDGILLSPGPGRPEDSGISPEVLQRYQHQVPILGVCLGHQLLTAAFGGKVIQGLRPMHGKTSLIRHDGQGLFADMPQPMQVMRYHSLIADPDTFPEDLTACAWTEQGEIMGIRHKIYKLAGVQFHPESVLTPAGDRLLANWLREVAKRSNI